MAALTAGEKFFRSLKLREIAEIERRTGLSMGELGGEGAPQAVLSAVMLTIAKKRRDVSYRFETAEELSMEEFGDQLTEAIGALGFEDDPADADANFTENSESQNSND